MKAIVALICLGSLCSAGAVRAEGAASEPEVVHFQSQGLDLAGELFKPKGEGPFPAVLYNHGSAPGMLNSQASQAIGPLFAAQGWVFFMPYRRGQGLSAKAGPYIGDQIAEAQRRGGMQDGAATLARLLGGNICRTNWPPCNGSRRRSSCRVAALPWPETRSAALKRSSVPRMHRTARPWMPPVARRAGPPHRSFRR